MKQESELSPGITLIIPVYNRAEIIKSTLLSVENQTRRPDRVILVDNNSTDNSLNVIEEWAGLKREEGWNVDVISEPRQGAASARKSGEELVRTRYVYFFDSDDVMHSDLLEKAMRDFEEDPDLKLTVWSLRYNRRSGVFSKRRIRKSNPLQNHLINGLLSTPSYVVSTEYLRSVGGWNPSVGGWDDWELGLRLLLGGGKMKITDEVRVEVAVHRDSITGLNYLHRKGDWEKTIAGMEHTTMNSSFPRRDYVMKHLAYRKANLAAHYRHEGDKAAARELLGNALKSEYLSPLNRLTLRLAFIYTSTGLPGAGGIFPPLL